MSETHRRRVVAKIYRFARVGLHTSRRRAADASAPLERAPTSERGVAEAEASSLDLRAAPKRGLCGGDCGGERPGAASSGHFTPVLAAL